MNGLSMNNPQEGKPLAITTINRRLNALRSYYARADKNHKLQQNPMEEIWI
jgi:site-specific recombinase XerD